MADLTGQTEHELQLALEGLVFHDPETRTRGNTPIAICPAT
jgi:hypothetical protein